MFDFVRKHNKWMMLLLFALIIPSFVLFGIENYQRMNDESHAAVAVVNGQKITRMEWEEAHKREAERLRASQPGIDPQLLDSPQAKYRTLESLVQQRVINEAANKLKLFVSDQRLARELLADPAVVALRNADGKLDEQRYSDMLKRRGTTPQVFESMLRSQLSQRQVIQGLLNAGEWIAPENADLVMRPFFEKREIQLAMFNAADYAAKITPSEADLKDYYSTHAAQFMAPEQATIEYVVLDLAAAEKQVKLSEQDVKTYYEQNKSRLAGKEERKASHILIGVDSKADQATRDAARKKAEQLLLQARKNPSGFAELARKNSEDPGSAPNGGDLGYFERDKMVKPFSDTAFTLKPGQISDVVQTDYGYHIILVTGARGGNDQGFEAMRPQIEADLKKQQAQQKYAEAVEALSDGVFKDPASLKPVADKLGLQVQTAVVTRTPPPAAQGALASNRFLQAVFSSDSLAKKQNINPVEVGSNQMASARIVTHEPAHQKPLDQVRDEIRQAYVQEKGAEQARAAGIAQLKQWTASPTQGGISAPSMTVSRMDALQQPPAVVNAALRADRNKLPAFEGVDLGRKGYAVVRVNKVLDADATTKALQTQQHPQVARALNEAEMMAYYESLKKLLKVEYKVPRPAPATLTP